MTTIKTSRLSIDYRQRANSHFICAPNTNWPYCQTSFRPLFSPYPSATWVLSLESVLRPKWLLATPTTAASISTASISRPGNWPSKNVANWPPPSPINNVCLQSNQTKTLFTRHIARFVICRSLDEASPLNWVSLNRFTCDYRYHLNSKIILLR